MEPYNTDTAIEDGVSIYCFSKIARKQDRDLTFDEHQRSKLDTIVFDGEISFEKMFHWLLTLKGEPKKIKNKSVEYEIQMHAQNDSLFDSYIFLFNLSVGKRIVSKLKR